MIHHLNLIQDSIYFSFLMSINSNYHSNLHFIQTFPTDFLYLITNYSLLILFIKQNKPIFLLIFNFLICQKLFFVFNMLHVQGLTLLLVFKDFKLFQSIYLLLEYLLQLKILIHHNLVIFIKVIHSFPFI